jgi:hypothetical protein
MVFGGVILTSSLNMGDHLSGPGTSSRPLMTSSELM